MTARRKWLIVVAAGVATIIASTATMPVALVWNASASVPIGLYRVAPARALRPGTLVVVRPDAGLARFMARRRYLETGALLVKPVAATAGQTVCWHGHVVTIDWRLAAIALDADSTGRPLPLWLGCRRLAPGMVFLLAPAVRTSFDGRYFGPVATSRIVGRALPVWTRP